MTQPFSFILTYSPEISNIFAYVTIRGTRFYIFTIFLFFLSLFHARLMKWVCGFVKMEAAGQVPKWAYTSNRTNLNIRDCANSNIEHDFKKRVEELEKNPPQNLSEQNANYSESEENETAGNFLNLEICELNEKRTRKSSKKSANTSQHERKSNISNGLFTINSVEPELNEQSVKLAIRAEKVKFVCFWLSNTLILSIHTFISYFLVMVMLGCNVWIVSAVILGSAFGARLAIEDYIEKYCCR